MGATNPWEYGDYYAWGETETKDDYSWSWATYKYCKGSYETLTKYCRNVEYGNGGFTDKLTTLEPADDVATAVLGAGWAMPTKADWDELGSQCYWVWTENYNNYNVSGYIVYKAKSASDKGIKVNSGGTPLESYSLSDAHIFLPAAGFRTKAYLGGVGSEGDYWSASLFENCSYGAHFGFFGSYNVNLTHYNYRRCGLSVRPVRRK